MNEVLQQIVLAILLVMPSSLIAAGSYFVLAINRKQRETLEQHIFNENRWRQDTVENLDRLENELIYLRNRLNDSELPRSQRESIGQQVRQQQERMMADMHRAMRDPFVSSALHLGAVAVPGADPPARAIGGYARTEDYSREYMGPAVFGGSPNLNPQSVSVSKETPSSKLALSVPPAPIPSASELARARRRQLFVPANRRDAETKPKLDVECPVGLDVALS